MNEVIVALLPWLPLMLKGFALNLWIGVLAMLLACLAGVCLGTLQRARSRVLRLGARGLTQLLRNAPWLVVMFL